MTVRIDPVLPPYSDAVAAELAKLTPPGMEPIGLFRTLAKNPRVLGRIRRAGLLDPGSITLREREIVILRTTALNGAEYEWGVHAAFFARAAGLDSRCLHATVWREADAECWQPAEVVLIRTCDELHVTGRLTDELWAELHRTFSDEQVLELLVLAGFYRTISYLVNGAGIALETAAPRFPPRTGEDRTGDVRG